MLKPRYILYTHTHTHTHTHTLSLSLSLRYSFFSIIFLITTVSAFCSGLICLFTSAQNGFELLSSILFLRFVWCDSEPQKALWVFPPPPFTHTHSSDDAHTHTHTHTHTKRQPVLTQLNRIQHNVDVQNQVHFEGLTLTKESWHWNTQKWTSINPPCHLLTLF